MPVLRMISAGDTVFLQKGDYFENLVIEIPVVILGDSYPHIHGGFRGHTILIRAPRTVINGLQISESGTRLIEDFAGIYVKGGNYAQIINNRIEGRLDLIPEDRGNGIHLWNSNGNLLSENNISFARDGIYFSFAANTDVKNNHVHHVRYGLHYMYSDDNSFTDNIFEHNMAGAALMYSKRILFTRNIFAACRGFRAYGLLYQSVDYTESVDNLIIDNSRGVFFDNSNFNRFESNDVVDNDLALHLMGNGEENIIINNNFINNHSSLVVNNKNTKTQWNNEKQGNYWSGYQGYDLDGDGIGDVSHKLQNVFQILETDIPEIRLYLHSPAANILEMAELSLPILSLVTE